jgi:ATP-dependent Clp protease protease subunit
MSIRTLPALTASAPKSEVRWDLHPQARARWDRAITNAAASSDSEATISILDTIGVDFFTGEGTTAKRISAALRSIGDNPVTVQVNSPGGDFFEGLAIYNLFREHPARVTMQVIGLAASAASVIVMAGDMIEIGKAALMFIHNTQWFAAGDRHVLLQAADEMKVFDDLSAELYGDRSGNDQGTIHQWMDKETFFSGSAAVEQGFADALLPSDAERNPSAARETSPAYRFEALLERHGVPRAERRKAVREFIEVMPSADLGGMPGAADLDESFAHLRAAAMRLTLTT